MKTYKLTEKLKLTSYKVTEEVSTLTNSIHHLWILDRSGSMNGFLPKVIDDLKKQCRTLKPGDALSFGYFSSKGQYGFPIKLFRIINEESYKELDRLFDQHKTTLGMTCFSEILNDTLETIKGASFLNMKTSCLFFSDGVANHPSREHEYKSVREIMPKLSEVLDNFLTVAHSNYADHDFLNEMAELSGGESVSSNSLESFTRLMDKYLRGVVKLTPRQLVKIDIPQDEIISVFSYSEDSFNTFKPTEKGLVQSAKNVWVISKGSATEEASLDTLYGSVLALNKKGDVFSAIQVLNDTIGDTYLANKLYNAITPSERGIINDEIKDAIFDSNKRYINGKSHNAHLLQPDAFCLLDLIDLLSQDEDAKFYPRHPEFKYNSIGRKTKQKDGYEKFNAYLENSCPISNFSWNKEFLNLSVLATVKGTVKLKDTVTVLNQLGEKDGTSFSEKIIIEKPLTLGDIKETFQWKNYTLVKDGFLNVEKLPISASERTLRLLLEIGLIDKLYPDNVNDIFVLDLTKIPIVNRNLIDKEVSAKNLLSNIFGENKLQAEIKVLNSLRKEIAPDQPKVQNQWTEEEREFLLLSGFREDGSYSPPIEKEDVEDYYDAVSFKTQIKGLSSLPSLSDTRKKVEEVKSKNKELTLSYSLMNNALNIFETESFNKLSSENKVKIIDLNLKLMKELLYKLRSDIQRDKFTLILGRKWFNDLDEMEAEQLVDFKVDENKLQAIIQVRRKPVAF